MNETVQIWVISGVSGAAILLLGAIWSEIRELNKQMHELMLTTTKQSGRLDTIEKIVDKLPCMNNIQCPNNRSQL
jgi:hypothetical protein